MEEKKIRTASKSVRSLPVKPASAKAANGVKGGSLSYGKIKWTYTQQKRFP